MTQYQSHNYRSFDLLTFLTRKLYPTCSTPAES